MEINDILKKIGHDFPDQKISHYYDFGDEYIFVLSLDDKIIPGDLMSQYKKVDKKTGKIENFIVSKDLEEYPKKVVNDALSNPVAVDASPLYINKLSKVLFTKRK